MGVQLAPVQAAAIHDIEMEDASLSDRELTCHVRDALLSVYWRDSESYDQLVGVLHRTEHLTPDDFALLVACLKALSGVAQYIDINHHLSLISCIFNMSLWNYGPVVMDALVELIISLAASGGFVDSCLAFLVNNFVPPPAFSEVLKQPRGLERKDQVLCCVHLAVKKIAYLVPLSPLRLALIISHRMFYPKPLPVIFVENVLRLERGSLREYMGTSYSFLLAVVDRLVDLDVNIIWEDRSQDGSYNGIFEMELEDGVDEDGDQSFRRSSRQEISGENSEELDSLMVLTFEHLKLCHGRGHLTKVFKTLLCSFEGTILNAYKSKFAQFVMFYACSLDPENCGVRFASLLANIFMRGNCTELCRMSAVAYLASYLSRAKFLSASFVATKLSRLVIWCSEYCNRDDIEINPKAHKVFYAGCQAIMYLLCFRMRSMLGIPGLKLQLVNMPIQAILEHPLKPLKVCLPSIVEEFLRQVQAANLFNASKAFVFNGMLESEFSKAFGGSERLDTFFPFDPCLLKKSDRFIKPCFIYWSMVKTTNDDDEDECSSDEDVTLNYADENGLNDADQGCPGNFEEEDFDLDFAVNKKSRTRRNSLNYRYGTEVHERMRMPSRIRPSASPESL